jgi:hypothetical protein
MRAPINLTLRTLTITALVFHVLYVVAFLSLTHSADSKLATLLRWRHYGAAVPASVLWYCATIGSVLLPAALLGILFRIRGARWALLIFQLLAVFVSFFGGLSVWPALARSLGGIAEICIVAILTLVFLAPDQMASNQRLERP